MRNSIITQLEFKDGIYQGQSLQSRYKQGIGVYLWENGSAYFGEWKSDQIDGNGILFLPPKTIVQGQFNSAKLHGNCLIQTRQAKYYGKWFNGLPNGNMTAYFNQGEVTIAFQDGKPIRGISQREQNCDIPNLKSVQCYNNTALQSIEWQDGTFYGVTSKNTTNKVSPNGLGIYVPRSELFQCGQFKDGALNGLGRIQQPSGEVYQGYFENGKYHGRGIYLFKEDELQWAKGMWRFGELIEIYQTGLVKNCTTPKDLMFPYSDHKNSISIRQPINLNNIKEIEDLFLIQFQRQQPIQRQTSATPSPEKKTKLSNYKYFQNSMSTSYQRISDALLGNKQNLSPQRKSTQLINYYKGQLRNIDQNEQPSQIKSSKPLSKNRKSNSNSKQYLIQSSIKKDSINNKSQSKLSQSAYVEEIKKLQTQFTKPFDHSKSVQSQQSQIYQTILDSEEQSSQRSEQYQKQQQQSSPNRSDQFIQKTSKNYQKEKSIEQSKKSIIDQSRQSIQSKQSKSPKNLQQSKISQQSKCKSSEANSKFQKQCDRDDQNKIKSEGNKSNIINIHKTEQLPLDTSEQQSQQLCESRQVKEFSQQRDSKQSRQSSQPVSQRISLKSINQVASQQITPQQSHRDQQEQNKLLVQSQQSQQKSQESQQLKVSQLSQQSQQQMIQQQQLDHSKKLSFCQQDFALDMRNTAIFNQVESNQSSQMKFHRHKRSQSQTDFDKFDIGDDTQMKLIKQQQLYMQQLIEQQQRELEQLKHQQQLLEEENQISQSRPGYKTNASIDSLESYPQQQSESFNQDFIKSVSDVLKSELKKKQEDSFVRDNQNNSPHFEQSKITNNQQSMFFNDIQSLDNVNINEKQNNRRSSQQHDDANKSRTDSIMIKKQPVSHSELDELYVDKLQDGQSRQSRYSGENKQQRSQSQQSSQRNYSIQQHSFYQQQSQEQFYSQKQPSVIQEKEESQSNSQKIKVDTFIENNKQEQLQINDHNLNQSFSSQQVSIISNQFQQEQNSIKKQIQDESIQFKQQSKHQDKNILQQKQQNTVSKRNLNNQSKNEESIDQMMKRQSQKQISQTQLKFVACPSQHSLPGQVSFSDKQFQIKPDQMSENIQVSINDDQSDTKQNIQEIKLQLAAQKEILSQLYHSIQESKQMKHSHFDSDKRMSEQRTVKRGMASEVFDPCSSPIKKVIITKGAYPAFTIIKSLSPIRL